MTYDSGLADMKKMKKPIATLTELIHLHKMMNQNPVFGTYQALALVSYSVNADNNSPIFLKGRSNSS